MKNEDSALQLDYAGWTIPKINGHIEHIQSPRGNSGCFQIDYGTSPNGEDNGNYGSYRFRFDLDACTLYNGKVNDTGLNYPNHYKCKWYIKYR